MFPRSFEDSGGHYQTSQSCNHFPKKKKKKSKTKTYKQSTLSDKYTPEDHAEEWYSKQYQNTVIQTRAESIQPHTESSRYVESNRDIDRTRVPRQTVIAIPITPVNGFHYKQSLKPRKIKSVTDWQQYFNVININSVYINENEIVIRGHHAQAQILADKIKQELKTFENFDVSVLKDSYNQYNIVKNKLSTTGYTHSLKTTNKVMFDYFYDLLQNHPDKHRKQIHNMTDIQIRPFNPDEPKTFSNCQIIICVGDKQDSISWKKCILPPYTSLF
jgi:hypothetical protein